MLRFEVGPDDLAATRFAIAPLFELAHLLRTLDRGGSQAGVPVRGTRWGRRAAELPDDVGTRALRVLRPPGWGPDFVSPPPRGMARTPADDLAAVRATPPAVARREIDAALATASRVDADVLAFLRSRDVVARLAGVLATTWDRVIGPDWPLLLAIVERDVLYRADRLVREGWAAAVEGLHPSLRWRDGAVEITRRPDATVELGGRGLLFVPSVFLHPSLATVVDPPWQPAVLYPARGSAALWEGNTATPAALGRLLGAARADLLLRLDEPATTTQLVRTSGQSLGAVGDHLKVLREAGFVERGRAGRSVVYRRTAVGDAVVAANG